MKIKAYIVTVLLFFSFGFISEGWSQQELVTGYYDPVNDWFVLEWDRPDYGRTTVIDDPPNKVDPVVRAYVIWDDSSKEYKYNFIISNGDKAKQLLSMIIIKFDSFIYGQVAPSTDWYMSEYRSGRTDTWKWFNPEGIPIGKTQNGFSFKSKGLPSIVNMTLWGERRARYSVPGDYDTDEIIASFSRVRKELKEQYKDKFGSVVRKTVGPKTPPAVFVPIDFLNYIISLKHEAYKFGWIVQGRDDDEGKHDDEEEGIMNSLDKKLEKAKAELVKGDTKEAVEKLKSFIHEVEALYKEGKEKEEKHEKEKEGHSHITSEAYALLKYNTVYLIEQLGGKVEEKEHNKD